MLLAPACAAALITGLVLRDRGVRRPMLDLSLLSRPGFLGNAVAASLVTFVLTGPLFVLPSYVQTVLGNGALGTGVRLLPTLGGLAVAARISGVPARRLGPRPVVAAGLLVLAGAAFLGAGTGGGDGYGACALWQTVAGFGFGTALMPAMDTARWAPCPGTGPAADPACCRRCGRPARRSWSRCSAARSLPATGTGWTRPGCRLRPPTAASPR
ncbi:MFS transporter [Actinacidiphila guanduensis]|uniref:Major facilitator superfamily (MFS) profile domain-containing protein n=1 Tax=Actinacidiphila guanduensis TaxID=310781 RepID=A0A1H0AEY9_9ACTN|nr:hypothetical protein SAMN05216259_103513 [Actinacidiphila guanduensis]